MKTLLAFAMLSLVSFTSNVNTPSLPDIVVETLDGEKVRTSTFNNDGKPFVVVVWASWCSPAKRQLNTIHEVYEDWQDETGVKIIGISVDDARNKHKVKPYVEGKGWNYEMYIDPSANIMNTINSKNPPHTLLFDGDGELVWEQNGYTDGDEDLLFEQIKTAAN